MDTDKRDGYELLFKKLMGSEKVRYFPSLAKYVGGAKPALMLSQLLYWYARSNGDVEKKSVADMERETGLLKVEQQTARAHLAQCGVVISELKGIPRIWHYRTDFDRLVELIQKDIHWVRKSPNDGKKSRPISAEKASQLNKELETPKEIPIKKLPQRAGKPRDPRLDHPAVIAFKDTLKRTPNETQRALIAESVNGALDLWIETLKHWDGHGWNKLNVTRQIAMLKAGGPKSCSQCAKGISDSPSGITYYD